MARRRSSLPPSTLSNLARRLAVLAASAIVNACVLQPAVDTSAGHVLDDTPPPEVIEPIVPPLPVVEAEPAQVPIDTYTVVVKDVPVGDLLFSLARDAGLDLDMQTSPDKTVTINAVERPLQEILSRVAQQAKLRYELFGSNLVIQDDLPYWHNYSVDYVNISRTSQSEVGVATQIATSGGSVGEDSSSSQQEGEGNLSKTIVKNSSENDFWQALQLGLNSIVAKNNEGADAQGESNSVIVNPMSGVATVRGTQSQHKRVQQYLDRTLINSQRQVLIEMTIVEVELSDKFQAGVDWQRLAAAGTDGLSLESDVLGANLQVSPFVALSYTDTDSSGDTITATVRMLQQFGDTKVLSSPKIMALNNQTALLKVVNERVYFTVELDIREATVELPERRTFTSQVHTVPVGLVMSVTPQVSSSGIVSLNIRPTISRITGFAVDPAPRLAGAEFDNLIPEIQVREIESLLQVLDGRTVVLGGLMQNERASQKDGVPGLSRIPGIGKLFSYSSDDLIKTELVIFLKPTIIANGTAPADSTRITDYYSSQDDMQKPASIQYR